MKFRNKIIKLKIDNIMKVFKHYEKLIEHRGIMGQSVSCCQSHVDLSMAKQELCVLAQKKGAKNE